MALNTVSSDRLSTNVKNTNFTAAEKQDLTDDILPLAGQLGNRNLIINGAMQVAQRGTSSTTNGFATVDRFLIFYDNTNEAPTQAQADVASGTTPYTLGFRKSYKITNGNQTGGAGADDALIILYRVEAQDLANSGWNYNSASSYITLSYWVKSSIAQNFYVTLKSGDGTPQKYATETGSLTADTWTKITKTIPGASNVQFDNDNGEGLEIEWSLFRGTDATGSMSLNAWAANNNSVRTPDQTSTWYTTNDATFEITGVQLEVGSVATDFEHRSFAQELALCQRYCQVLGGNRTQELLMHATFNGAGAVTGFYEAAVQFRVKPSFSISNVAHVNCYGFNSVDAGSPTAMTLINAMTDKHWIYIDSSLSSNVGTGGLTVMVRANSTTACKFTLDAEL